MKTRRTYPAGVVLIAALAVVVGFVWGFGDGLIAVAGAGLVAFQLFTLYQLLGSLGSTAEALRFGILSKGLMALSAFLILILSGLLLGRVDRHGSHAFMLGIALVYCLLITWGLEQR